MLAEVSFGYKSQHANAGSYIALLREQENEYKVLAL